MNYNRGILVEEEENQIVPNRAKQFYLLKEDNEKTMVVEPLMELGIILSKQNQNPESAESTVRKRRNVTKDEPYSQTNSEYTKEQLNHVKRVKKCENYYEILEVSKDATGNDIIEAYKRLAFQLHPDKNKAPGAVKAFKAIGKAVAILIDPEQRKQYYNDMYGLEKERMQNAHTNSQQTNRYSRSNRCIQLLKMLSILLLLSYMLYMTSSFSTYDNPINKTIDNTEPEYSLYKNKMYCVARKTNYTSEKYTVTYYVKENFHYKDEDSLKAMEFFIMEKYVENLRQECIKQHIFKQKIIKQKMKSNNPEDVMHLKTINLTMPYCQRYEEMTGHNAINMN